jgi:hypothetical protein
MRWNVGFLMVIVVSVSVAGPVLSQECGVRFTRGNVLHGLFLKGVATDGTTDVYVGTSPDEYAGNHMVVVGDSDAKPWARVDLGAGGELTGVVWGGGQFVAVGFDALEHVSRIVTSADAFEWTQRQSTGGIEFRDVAYGGGRFIAVGLGYSPIANCQVWSSPDGVTWADASASAPAQDFSSILYDGRRFVAVATSPGGYPRAYGSEDAVGWELLGTIPTASYAPRLAFGAGTYAVVPGGPGSDGPLITTTDFISFEERGVEGGVGLQGVGFTASGFLAVGRARCFSAGGRTCAILLRLMPDGTWGVTPSYLQGLLNGIGRTRRGYSAFGLMSVFSSPDGKDWAYGPADIGATVGSIACAGGVCVAVVADTTSDNLNASALLASRDGRVWRPVGLPEVGYGQELGSVGYANGHFVTLGADGLARQLVVGRSYDGVSWSAERAPLSVAWPNLSLWGANGKLFGTAMGRTFLSEDDGSSWTPVLDGFELNTGIYQDGRFLAVGSRGAVAMSGDGATWSVSQARDFAGFVGLASGNGLLLAVGTCSGQDCWALVSTDGTRWQERIIGGGTPLGVVYDSGWFVVRTNHATYVSQDALTWYDFPDSLELEGEIPYAFSGSDGLFVAVGQAGFFTTATCGPIYPWVGSMFALKSPFEISAVGGNFFPGLRLEINGQPWAKIKRTSTSVVRIKGGRALKALVPRNTPATFRFTNPNGGESDPFIWQWQ